MKKSGKGKSAGVAQRVKKTADKARKELKTKAGEASGATRRTTLRAAKQVVGLEEKAFKAAIKAIGRLQDTSQKKISKGLKDSDWLPAEGQEAVDEWLKVLHNGRVEFQNSMEKSFGLLNKFLDRAESEEKKEAPAKKKASAKKKPAAKKKAPAKKKAAAKKKPAAKKKAAAKKKTSA